MFQVVSSTRSRTNAERISSSAAAARVSPKDRPEHLPRARRTSDGHLSARSIARRPDKGRTERKKKTFRYIEDKRWRWPGVTARWPYTAARPSVAICRCGGVARGDRSDEDYSASKIIEFAGGRRGGQKNSKETKSSKIYLPNGSCAECFTYSYYIILCNSRF